ncbi:MAG: hypothetical protein U0354_19250 [Candidatus Sericytochromatia bacterium]
MKKSLISALFLSYILTSCVVQPVQNNAPTNNNTNNNSLNNNNSSSSSSRSNSNNSTNNNDNSSNNTNNSNTGNNSNNSSSNSNNNSDNFAPDYTTEEIKSKEKEQVKTTVNVIDAKTEQTINQNIEVTVVGEDKDKVEKAEFISNTGLITIFLKRGVFPEENDPIKIDLLLEIESFSPVRLPVNILNNLKPPTDKTLVNSNEFSTKMVNINNTPEGITTSSVEATADNNGEVKENINLSVTDSKDGFKTDIIFDKNTKFIDDKGVPLTGKLKCSVTYFNPKSEKALELFPGGLDVTVSKDGALSKGFFISGGLIDLNVKDSNGREAEVVTNPNNKTPVRVNTQIPSDITNPNTNQTIQPNQTIPYWSYNSKKGTWEYLGEAFIFDKNKINDIKINKYSVTYYLSNIDRIFNLDYFFKFINLGSCNQKVRFKINPKDKIYHASYSDYITLRPAKYLIGSNYYFLQPLNHLTELTFVTTPVINNFEHEINISFSYLSNNNRLYINKTIYYTPKSTCDVLDISLELNKTITINEPSSGGSSGGGGSTLGSLTTSGPIGTGGL